MMSLSIFNENEKAVEYSGLMQSYDSVVHRITSILRVMFFVR